MDRSYLCRIYVAISHSLQMAVVNQIFLSDLALRLLCVIALDRFGDFVSDEVMPPVIDAVLL